MLMNKVLTKHGKLFLYFLFVFIFLSSQICFAQEPTPDVQQKRAEQIVPLLDKFITASVKKKGAPGCVIAVVGPKTVYFLKAYGVKKLGKPDLLTTRTLFQMGSVSKPLTSTLVMLLEAQNKLSVEAPVTTYLKDFKLQGQNDPLLIKHLLSHTSGVPRYGFNALIENSSPREGLFKKAQHTLVTAQPGRSFDYHNVMFSLIEDVLSASLKQPFEKIMRDNLFKPLKMEYASIGLQRLKKAADRATPHIINKKGKLIPLKNYSSAYYKVAAAGGVNASMEDLIPFLQLQLGGFPKLLPSEERSLLHTPQVTEDELPWWLKNQSAHIGKAGYALGWRWMDYGNERAIFHGGWVKGFHPMIAFLPEHNIGIIILHHAETSFILDATFNFLDLYLGFS